MRSHDSEIVAIYKGCKVTSEEVHLLSEKKPQFLLHNLLDLFDVHNNRLAQRMRWSGLARMLVKFHKCYERSYSWTAT